MALSCSTNLTFIELFCWAVKPPFLLGFWVELSENEWPLVILFSVFTAGKPPNVAFSSWLGLSFELILSESELDIFFTRECLMTTIECVAKVWISYKISRRVTGVLGARWFYDIFPFSSSMPPLSSTGSFLRKRPSVKDLFVGSRSLRPWSRRVR